MGGENVRGQMERGLIKYRQGMKDKRRRLEAGCKKQDWMHGK